MPELLEGYGVVLRRWTASDVEAFAAAVEQSAEHLRPWVAWMASEPLLLDERRAILARREREWANGGDVALAILVDGGVAGSCGLHRCAPAALEIGYWVHPSFLRRGLATAASRLLTDAAFSIAGIERVEIHHDKANVASCRVPERLGFEFVGERPNERPAPRDSGIDWMWHISRDAWLAQRRPDRHPPNGARASRAKRHSPGLGS